MKQKKAKSNRQSLICLLICSLMGFFSTSCQDDKKNSEVYDPSQLENIKSLDPLL